MVATRAALEVSAAKYFSCGPHNLGGLEFTYGLLEAQSPQYHLVVLALHSSLSAKI